MVVERRIITSQDGASHVVSLVYDAQRGELVQIIESKAIDFPPPTQDTFIKRSESNE